MGYPLTAQPHPTACSPPSLIPLTDILIPFLPFPPLPPLPETVVYYLAVYRRLPVDWFLACLPCGVPLPCPLCSPACLTLAFPLPCLPPALPCLHCLTAYLIPVLPYPFLPTMPTLPSHSPYIPCYYTLHCPLPHYSPLCSWLPHGMCMYLHYSLGIYQCNYRFPSPLPQAVHYPHLVPCTLPFCPPQVHGSFGRGTGRRMSGWRGVLPAYSVQLFDGVMHTPACHPNCDFFCPSLQHAPCVITFMPPTVCLPASTPFLCPMIPPGMGLCPLPLPLHYHCLPAIPTGAAYLPLIFLPALAQFFVPRLTLPACACLPAFLFSGRDGGPCLPRLC